MLRERRACRGRIQRLLTANRRRKAGGLTSGRGDDAAAQRGDRRRQRRFKWTRSTSNSQRQFVQKSDQSKERTYSETDEAHVELLLDDLSDGRGRAREGVGGVRRGRVRERALGRHGRQGKVGVRHGRRREGFWVEMRWRRKNSVGEGVRVAEGIEDEELGGVILATASKSSRDTCSFFLISPIARTAAVGRSNLKALLVPETFKKTVIADPHLSPKLALQPTSPRCRVRPQRQQRQPRSSSISSATDSATSRIL